MTTIAVQISPEAKSAYFAEYLQVAEGELRQAMGEVPVNLVQKGLLDFFYLQANEVDFDSLLKLSFAQGVYEVQGESLLPLDMAPEFVLHDDFVFGSKFKGKTNERLTQMLINVGLAAIGNKPAADVSLLDPMCGRATTLIWAMRYGLKARGIEQDAKALEDVRRNLKKWTKLHRQKHKMTDGVIEGAGKKGEGKFLDFAAEKTSLRMVIGDATQTDKIFRKEKFDLIVSDLPYGVQHFSSDKQRSPLAVISQCVTPWKQVLKKRGAIVLAFNTYLPSRDEMIEVFAQAGFAADAFSVAHRMSESIVRDVLILKPND